MGAFVTSFEFGFSHALPVEIHAVCVVYETVENGIHCPADDCKAIAERGEGGLANDVTPCVDR